MQQTWRENRSDTRNEWKERLRVKEFLLRSFHKLLLGVSCRCLALKVALVLPFTLLLTGSDNRLLDTLASVGHKGARLVLCLLLDLTTDSWSCYNGLFLASLTY